MTIEVDRDELAEIAELHQRAEIEALLARTEASIARIQGRRAPSVLTAAELQGMEFPAPRWAVPGLVPEGVCLLCGPPKIGKSRLALQLAVAVAYGGIALSHCEVAQGGALVLALEDGPRRLQERITALTRDVSGPWPDDLVFATEWPRLGEGGEEALDSFLTTHPRTRFVIADVVQMLRPAASARDSTYAADYNVMRTLKQVSDAHHVALMAVHHTRKMAADDPLSLVSGTNGLAGAVDSVLILQREPNGADAVLYLRGRDVEESHHKLTYDRETGAWHITGEARAQPLSETREKIIVTLERAWPQALSPKEIAAATELAEGTVRQRLHHLDQAGLIRRVQRGLYTVTDPPPDDPSLPPRNNRNNRNNGHEGSVPEPVAHDDCYDVPLDRRNVDPLQNPHNRAEPDPLVTNGTDVMRGASLTVPWEEA